VTIRFATFNLLHGVPVLVSSGPANGASLPAGDDALLREAVAGIDADIIGLQEVDVWQPRSALAHQVASVAQALDAHEWLFAASVDGTPGEDGWTEAGDHHVHGSADGHRGSPGQPLYGVGLVSRRPVLRWQTIRFDPAPLSLPLMIPSQPRPRFIKVADEPRSAIAAVIDGDRGHFTVVTTHLSFVPGFNVRQLRQLRTWLADLPRPLILMGDFNLPGSLPARITGYTSLVKQPTYPSMRPSAQLDHILADGLSDDAMTTAATVHRLPVSDHAAVSVDLDV
jgi:endonuclease/exonuclease/phosphatase family metal-dependent hydrolase